MSHRNVERAIGRLVTDEGFRRRFTKDPQAALKDLTESGAELTICELKALSSIDPRILARMADVIDPRLQKCDLERGDQ